jgi:hypothetical protein
MGDIIENAGMAAKSQLAYLLSVSARDRARSVASALDGWETGARALYLALADALGRAIDLGIVPHHLPSERALAGELHVSRTTVALAYEVLRERALIERERGSATTARSSHHIVCPDPLQCVRTFFQSDETVGAHPR